MTYRFAWTTPSTYLWAGVVDQTVLFGLIRRIEDLRLVLLDVATIHPDGP